MCKFDNINNSMTTTLLNCNTLTTTSAIVDNLVNVKNIYSWFKFINDTIASKVDVNNLTSNGDIIHIILIYHQIQL